MAVAAQEPCRESVARTCCVDNLGYGSGSTVDTCVAEIGTASGGTQGNYEKLAVLFSQGLNTGNGGVVVTRQTEKADIYLLDVPLEQFEVRVRQEISEIDSGLASGWNRHQLIKQTDYL
jgi:hypothetical protein